MNDGAVLKRYAWCSCREQVLEMCLEVGVGEGRAAYGQVAVGEGELEEVEIHGTVDSAGVPAEHLELQGAGTAVPVPLDVPGDAMDLVGGEGDADLALRAVHPGLRDDPFRGVGEGSVLKGGDVIIKLAGKKVENVYDYTDAIGELKAGQKTSIEIKRKGKEISLPIVPGSRD